MRFGKRASLVQLRYWGTHWAFAERLGSKLTEAGRKCGTQKVDRLLEAVAVAADVSLSV